MADTTAAEAPNPAALVRIGDRGVMLRSLEDLIRFARLAVSHGAAPKGMNEGQAVLAIEAGMERGLGPLGGLQQCVVINGVLSWRGQGAAALIQNSPVCKPGTLRFWSEGEGPAQKGVAVAHRAGYREPDRREFTLEDARRGGLSGKDGPWKQYPGRMLAWRALGLLARDVFPDVLGGFPLAEEAADFEPVTVESRPAGDRREMLPPAQPDPLFDALGGQEQDAPTPPSEAEPAEPEHDETKAPEETPEREPGSDDDDPAPTAAPVAATKCKRRDLFE